MPSRRPSSDSLQQQIADALTFSRGMAEFSRDELANKLGVSERTVRRVESGVTYPRAGLAERWLKACKMSIAVSIVGASGGRSKPQ